jgi:hypothetical protein
MSQAIQFYTIKIFSKKFLSEFDGNTIPFSSKSIYECLKGLFQGTETKSQEYVEKYFDAVELGYLEIHLSELEKIDPDLNQKYEYIFDPKSDPFSFINKELWSNLEKIIFDKTKQCLSDNEESKSLKNNMKISQDYKKLLDLFQKRILFMAIF